MILQGKHQSFSTTSFCKSNFPFPSKLIGLPSECMHLQRRKFKVKFLVHASAVWHNLLLQVGAVNALARLHLSLTSRPWNWQPGKDTSISVRRVTTSQLENKSTACGLRRLHIRWSPPKATAAQKRAKLQNVILGAAELRWGWTHSVRKIFVSVLHRLTT